MTLPNIDPVLLHIWGPFSIRWYALAYVAGILLGWRYALTLVRRESLWGRAGPPATSAQIDDLVLWIALGVIGGGRIGYVLFYQPQMIWESPAQILQLWDGGMSFHGGLIGVMLAIVFFARSNKLNLLSLGDAVAPVVPIGLFFGRVANFINGELWGRPTDAPWGVIFCNEQIRSTLGWCPAGDVPRHPSQLYEAGLEGLLLFAVLAFAAWRGRALEKPGLVTGLFLLIYGLSRAALENFREPDSFMPEFAFGLTMGMMLSIPMILGGAWLIWRAVRPAPAQAA